MGESQQPFSYPERTLWARTIPAWFEKTLKGREAWWDELWPEGS